MQCQSAPVIATLAPGDLPGQAAQEPHYGKIDETRRKAVARQQFEKYPVGIGQGQMLVTPLQMALVASGVANGGAVMRGVYTECQVRWYRLQRCDVEIAAASVPS